MSVINNEMTIVIPNTYEVNTSNSNMTCKNLLLKEAIKDNNLDLIKQYIHDTAPSFTSDGLGWIEFAFANSKKEIATYVEEFFKNKEWYHTCEAFYQICIRDNDLDYLKYSHQHYGIFNRKWHCCGSECFGIRGCRSKDMNLLDYAIYEERLEITEWLFSIGMLPIKSNSIMTYKSLLLREAIKDNNLDLIKRYIDDASPSFISDGLGWAKYAAKVGNKEIAEYVYEFFDQKENDYGCEQFLQECFDKNDLESLKYAHKHFGSIGPTLHMCESQCSDGECERYKNNLLDDALHMKKTDIINWLYSIGMVPNNH